VLDAQISGAFSYHGFVPLLNALSQQETQAEQREEPESFAEDALVILVNVTCPGTSATPRSCAPNVMFVKKKKISL